MSKHTPTPWFVSNADEKAIIDRQAFFIATTEIGSISSEQKKVNAALIVKAVNNHEKLLSLAKKLIEYLPEQQWNEFCEREFDPNFLIKECEQ